jgi:hypothetical protein
MEAILRYLGRVPASWCKLNFKSNSTSSWTANIARLPVESFNLKSAMKTTLNILSMALGLGQLRMASALDDGIGLKPHMGWSSWVRKPGLRHVEDGGFHRLIHNLDALRMLPNAMLLRPNTLLIRPPSSSRWASRTSGMSVSTLISVTISAQCLLIPAARHQHRRLLVHWQSGSCRKAGT